MEGEKHGTVISEVLMPKWSAPGGADQSKSTGHIFKLEIAKVVNKLSNECNLMDWGGAYN